MVTITAATWANLASACDLVLDKLRRQMEHDVDDAKTWLVLAKLYNDGVRIDITPENPGNDEKD